ncbi:MAG: hypothetical protein U1F42_10945 [Candidatus Competibacteraceae bacterium]
MPSSDLLPQGLDVGDTAIQPLAGQRGKLTLGHIELTTMLGGVVKFQLTGDPTASSGGKTLYKAAGVWVLRLCKKQEAAVYRVDGEISE